MRSFVWLVLATLVVAVQAAPQHVSPESGKTASLPKIEFSDNHRAAGFLHQRVLNLSLIADTGVWYPAGENEPGIPIQAFRDSNVPVLLSGAFRRRELLSMTAPTNPHVTWAEWCWVSQYALKRGAKGLPRSIPNDI